jgi:3-oxoacyl-[acyl-carrier protein] reductase
MPPAPRSTRKRVGALPSPPVGTDEGSHLLDGKVALITGAASGQGRAASVLFAKHGARILVADMNDAGSDETVAMVDETGSKAVAFHADVSQRDDVDRMVGACTDAFGRVDVLYNNAAIQMSGRLVDCTEEQWDITIRTNLTAIFWACRAAIPHMLAGDGGSIINTASVLGLIGSEGYAAYGAAKAGLVHLTRAIAAECGPKVRANVIAPGSIDTPRFRKVATEMPNGESFVHNLEQMIPLRRLGLAEDIAHIALFLASNESAYTTGAVIPADGGLAAMR